MDFTIFYKRILNSVADWKALGEYDLLISMCDCSDRVNSNFNNIDAKNKHWLLSPHYTIPTSRRPTSGNIFEYAFYDEDDFLVHYFNDISGLINVKSRICLDITGFIRPFIMYIVRYLHTIGVKKFDVVYSEPNRYIRSEETEFSGFVDIVKTVPGCSANNLNSKTDNDVLVLATGYDDKLITAVADQKRHCTIKYQIFGFPSMQPDMYQESVLRSFNAKESLGSDVITMYSPAFDPFVTAQILKEIVDTNKKATNFYLSPISTKPQVLGFIVYFIWEGIDKYSNLIFPYSRSYSINTCQGVNKGWHYNVELP